MSTCKVPQLCLHKGSGQAYIKLDGRRVYLGKHGSPGADRRYNDEVSRWRDRQESSRLPDIRIGELILIYRERHVRTHYVKHGKPTSEQSIVDSAMRFLSRHRMLVATEFGPRLLKETRADMVKAGLSRDTVNRYTTRIKQMFEWAVSEELLSERVFVALKTVKALLAGRTEAPDYEPIRPVPARDVFAIKRLVGRQIFAMIKLQLRTGGRPGELVLMRTCDIDVSGAIWHYSPHVHKLEHKRIPRLIEIGPRAQRILQPFLRPDKPEACIFSPRDAEIDRGRTPDSRHRERYDIHSYRRAVQRACERAGVSVWFPNQLRHVFGTRSRREGGLEMTRILLGHTSVTTSEIYAEPDRTGARAVISRIG